MSTLVESAVEMIRKPIRKHLSEWIHDRVLASWMGPMKIDWVREAVDSSAGDASHAADEVLVSSRSVEKAMQAALDEFFDTLAERLDQHQREHQEEGFDPEAELGNLREQLERDAGFELEG